MELTKLIRASGFFLSSAVTISLGILLLDLIRSNLMSLSGFAFIIPLFIGSILLRGITWKRIYNESRRPLYLITCVLVLVLGFSFLIGFLAYASSQTILYNLSDYSGITVLFFVSLLWTAYSVAESFSVYKTFKSAVFKFARLIIAPIVLVELSLAYLIGYFSYALPIALFLLAAATAFVGFGFLLD